MARKKKERLDFSIAAALRFSRKNTRCDWLEAEAGSQSDDAAGKSTAYRAEIGAASVIGDLVRVKV